MMVVPRCSLADMHRANRDLAIAWLTQSARSGAANRREESDGCQDDPESDKGAKYAAECGGRGQAVRVGRSGHVPGRAIVDRGPQTSPQGSPRRPSGANGRSPASGWTRRAVRRRIAATAGRASGRQRRQADRDEQQGRRSHMFGEWLCRPNYYFQ